MKHIIKTVLLRFFDILGSYLFWMVRYSNHPERYPLEKRYQKVRNLIVGVLRAMKVNTLVLGEENICDNSACYFANHTSAGEVLLYFDIFKKPISFVGKQEVKELPFVGRVFSSCDGLFLNRSNLKQELRVMMKVESRLKNNETNYFIYPEGTRNRDPLHKLLPFHPGTFRSAMKAGVPIVPVVNYGGFRILSMKYDHKEYPTIVKFLKPIMPEEYSEMTTEEVARLVQNMIQKELTFNVRKLDHENMIKTKALNYRFNRIY